MDRNTLIGLVLIFGILAGSFYVMKPSEQELKQEQLLQDSLKMVREGKMHITDSLADAKSIHIDSAQILSSSFGAARLGEEEIVTLENDQIIAKVSTKGGQVKSVQLKNETNFDGKPLMLLDENNSKFGFTFKADGENVHTADLFFTPQGGNIKVSGKDSTSLSFRLNYSDTQYLEYTYSLKGDGYNLGLDVKAVGIQNLMDVNTRTIALNWESTLLQKELNIKSERQKSSIFYKEIDGNVDNLSESRDDEEMLDKDQLAWIAFKQHFFSATIASSQPMTNTALKVTTDPADGIVKHYSATAHLAFAAQQDNQYSFNFFFGPNQYKVLKAQGDDFEKIIKMGWGPMSWINKYITVPLFDLLDGFHLGYGVIILLLTLVLKTILFPLTYKSYQSMAKMRVLKPQIDEIKERVGEDNAVLVQQETMKLYKQAGVNPLGGCLPLVLQMPFTLAFFFFFPNLFELRGESFLWVKDLSTYDAPITFAPFFGISHISFMCILMTLTTVLSTWYNNSTQSSAANNQMKYIGYFMPLIFFFVLNDYPAGLNYYYFLSAVLTFLTQFIIRQFVDDDKILAKIEENKKKPKSEKKSSFQQKMEEMMRQQQAAQQNRK